MTTVTIQPTGISADDVLAVARGTATVVLDPATRDAMATSRAIVDGIEAAGRPVYGVSTGFGALANTFVAPERRAELQHALIRSHAAGVGAPMPREVVRAMMLLRVRSLALGRSGVRPLVAEALVDLLNHDITPWVPEHGSLGASGDLAPLAHCALVLLGEGWVLGPTGERQDAADVLHAAGLKPIELAAKEGLALINGTDGMLGMLLLAIHDAAHLFAMADVTAALAIEAMLGSERPFLPELHAIRPHPGQAASAANIHRLLQDSRVMDSHRDDLAHAVQDAYSMRCAPQVAGAARDTLDFVRTVAGRELVSVVDNPVVLPDGRVESTGNFHGAPLGFAADFLAIAAAEVGAIAERRVDRLLDVTRSRSCPRFSPRRRGQLRADDRPVHGCRDRRGEPAAGRPGLGGLAAHQRYAGGPRLDGLGRGQEAADGAGQPDQPARGGAAGRRTRAAVARSVGAVAGGSGGGRRAERAGRRAGPGRVPRPGAGGGPRGAGRPRAARRHRTGGRPAGLTSARLPSAAGQAAGGSTVVPGASWCRTPGKRGLSSG
ncbi:hypothetical protein GCM10027614_63020 [Micromonospora vulcania]